MARLFDIAAMIGAVALFTAPTGASASLDGQVAPLPAASAYGKSRPRGAPFPKQLTVYDRRGKPVWKLADTGEYLQPRLSRDGTRLAVSKFEWDTGKSHIWVFDLGGGRPIQVTSSSESEFQPVWSADDRDIAFSSYRDNFGGLYRKAASGAGSDELLYRAPFRGVLNLSDWSLDRRFLSYWTGGVVYVAPLEGQRPSSDYETIALVGWDGSRDDVMAANESSFSPDGRFVAYRGDAMGPNETYRNEIYVRRFDPAASGERNPEGVLLAPLTATWQVSRDGAAGLVFWRNDGRELYYLAADGWMMAVDITTRPSFRASPPRRLFRAPHTLPVSETRPLRALGSVSPNGRRFAFAVPLPPARTTVRLPLDVLDKYIGKYSLPNGNMLIVSRDGDHLVLYDGFVRRELVAESDRSFFFKLTNGDIEFTISGGMVSHLTWYSWFSGATTTTAKRS